MEKVKNFLIFIMKRFFLITCIIGVFQVRCRCFCLERVVDIAPVPTSVVLSALPQESVVRALPQAQAQAAPPIVTRAIDPSPRGDRGHKTKSNEDRGKGGGRTGERGSSINIRV